MDEEFHDDSVEVLRSSPGEFRRRFRTTVEDFALNLHGCRDTFLIKLAECGNVAESAAAVGALYRVPQKWAEKDKQFADEWAGAVALFEAKLERAVLHRAVEGVDEPVFYQGQECGTVKKYSDPLLQSLLRKQSPSWREALKSGSEVTVSTSVQTLQFAPGTRELSADDIRARLRAAPAEARAALAAAFDPSVQLIPAEPTDLRAHAIPPAPTPTSAPRTTDTVLVQAPDHTDADK